MIVLFILSQGNHDFTKTPLRDLFVGRSALILIINFNSIFEFDCGMIYKNVMANINRDSNKNLIWNVELTVPWT